ncbi:hypothetical protein GCM10010261_64300 [Streptomyces pilosus]|nr:hypothetical protein GCM10010261_64300 [Streptomyces pilosus]
MRGRRERREPYLSGLRTDRTSYGPFVTFSDPDGSGWVIQEVMQRLPGR